MAKAVKSNRKIKCELLNIRSPVLLLLQKKSHTRKGF